MACSVIPPAGPPRLPTTMTPAERAQVYFANALLPAPLPTPPRSKMLPLLPTPPCLVLLPMMSKPKPSLADADERWDARKNKAALSVSVPGGRADAVDRWDAHKVRPALSTSSSPSSSTSSTSPGSSWASSSSSQKWNSNKKQRAVSRAASEERWDARKQKPRPPQARELDLDDDKSSTGRNDVEVDTPSRQAFYAGPSFIASPEPGMLPMPSFMVRAA